MIIELVIFLLLLHFLNKMKNQTKKIKKEIEKKVYFLSKITFDFITRQCTCDCKKETNQITNMKWHETSSFCLAFKIKSKLFTDCFYWLICRCEPSKSGRFCVNIDNQKVPYNTGQ